METSPTIGKLAAALTKFQTEVPNVLKDSTNPYFRSKYASLENFITTIKPLLDKTGLSYSQFPDADGLTTLIMHTSGEWMKATANLHLAKQDPQGQGSAITYMRRYALGAALGLATDEDDDGNAAARPKTSYTVERKVPAADDEAGGAVIQTVQTEEQFVDDEVTEMQKQGIKEMLRQLKRPMSKKAVKELTGLDFEEKNYDAIYKALRKAVEKTDPLETIAA